MLSYIIAYVFSSYALATLTSAIDVLFATEFFLILYSAKIPNAITVILILNKQLIYTNTFKAWHFSFRNFHFNLVFVSNT